MVTALLGFVFALAESGLGLGAVVPGEVAISGLATRVDGVLPLLVLGLFVALGASAGDHLGYLVGWHGGLRLRGSRLVARLGVGRWDRATELMQAHGFWAVLVSRVLPFVRTVMPVVAGAAHLRYPAFALASLVGAAGWATVWVGAGTGVAASGVLRNTPLVAAALAIVTAALVVTTVVRRRRRRRAEAGSAAVEPERVLVCAR